MKIGERRTNGGVIGEFTAENNSCYKSIFNCCVKEINKPVECRISWRGGSWKISRIKRSGKTFIPSTKVRILKKEDIELPKKKVNLWASI